MATAQWSCGAGFDSGSVVVWLYWLGCTHSHTHHKHTVHVKTTCSVLAAKTLSSSQSIKPCYANCEIIISVSTSAEYPNSHSISRIILLCSFSVSTIPPPHLLVSTIRFSLFFCGIFLSNSSSAKLIHKSGRTTSKESIVKVKCWWSFFCCTVEVWEGISTVHIFDRSDVCYSA